MKKNDTEDKRVRKVFERAVEVLEGEDAAREWMNSNENWAFDGHVPQELAKESNDGAKWVLDVLNRLEHGIVS